MQDNVNAVNVLNSIVKNFGDEKVSTCVGGAIKLQVKFLASGDILNISNMLQWSDIQVKRSGVGILVLFIPKLNSGHYPQETLDAMNLIKGDIEEEEAISFSSVRDFYEKLPYEVSMKAFDNTSKNKLDMQVPSLNEAILRSFYINHSPEGTEYWQDIILENSTKD